MNGAAQWEVATALDVLCPMYAIIDATGHIVGAGAALGKLHPNGCVIGLRLLEILELKRPRTGSSMSDLHALTGSKLHFRLRHPPRTELKGVLVSLSENAAMGPKGGAILNLSFGISIVSAVGDFCLTSADFAATDLAVEMLYLVEANSVATEASRKLTMRLHGAKAAAEEQAQTDTLTGLMNRRAMDRVLARLIELERDFCLMQLDLDYFKAVNDRLGHAAGDHVLQHAAKLMLGETRGDDAVFRVGGDEFILIFAQLTDRRVVAEIADRLIRGLEQPIPFNGQECMISASIGAALSRDYEMPGADQMMEDADVALYTAKNQGRGCHVIHDPAQP